MSNKVINLKTKIKESEKQNSPIVVTNLEQQGEISYEEEKMYLQGEPHIEPTSCDNEDNFSQKEEPIKTEPREPKKIFRPREKYLMDKLNSLKFDKQLLNSIQKDLGNQIENIKTQIQNKDILITEVPKDLNKY